MPLKLLCLSPFHVDNYVLSAGWDSTVNADLKVGPLNIISTKVCQKKLKKIILGGNWDQGFTSDFSCIENNSNTITGMFAN